MSMKKKPNHISVLDYQHIHKKTSRYILKAIQQDQSIDMSLIPNNITSAQIEKIKYIYKEKVRELEITSHQEVRPRNLPFYYILKDKFPNFTWKALKNKNSHKFAFNFDIEAPRIKNLRPSLASLLMHNINTEVDTPLHRRYPSIEKLPPALVSDLGSLMESLQIIYPDRVTMDCIISWFLRGLQGETLTLFSPVCPDYSVEQKKSHGGYTNYLFTFNELWSGIGPIARRILDALPHLDKLFKKYHLKIVPIIAVGDFEALDELTLRKVNLTFQEFLSRIQSSVDMIQKESLIPIKSYKFTDICGGYEPWKVYIRKFQKMFEKGLYGYSNLNPLKLLDILKARKSLYDRWQGERERLEDYLPQLLNQGCEYAAMGSIIYSNFNNCLILGADHSVMSPFYSTEQFIPTLYLKRISY